MNLVDDFFEYLGILLLLVNTVLYLKSYSNYKDTIALKYFSWYLLGICAIQVIGIVFAHYRINNLYLSHLYFWTQLIMLAVFYRNLFEQNQKKYISIVIGSVSIILIIQYLIKPHLFFKFNTLEIFITTFPLVVFSMIHLYNSLSKKGKFMYINAGILIYLTTSTLIYILGNYLASYKSDLITHIWFLNKVLYVIYMSLILIEWKTNILPLKNK